MASRKPSFPSPSEPNLRRLGVGQSPAERPIRAQAIVALVGVLVLVAVPLYFLRKPSDTAAEKADQHNQVAKRSLIRSQLDAGVPKANVRLGPIQRVRCSAAPNKEGNEGNLCDRLPLLERQLTEAIRKNVDCAPRTGKEGTINYVLTLDFVHKRMSVFPGASGQWKGPQAKAATKCVKRSFPKIDWDNTSHRYRYYIIAQMATFPVPDPLKALPRFD